MRAEQELVAVGRPPRLLDVDQDVQQAERARACRRAAPSSVAAASRKPPIGSPLPANQRLPWQPAEQQRLQRAQQSRRQSASAERRQAARRPGRGTGRPCGGGSARWRHRVLRAWWWSPALRCRGRRGRGGTRVQELSDMTSFPRGVVHPAASTSGRGASLLDDGFGLSGDTGSLPRAGDRKPPHGPPA